jgi:hypothetical protein
MTRRALPLLFLLLIASAGSARAQEPELERVLDRLADFWARGNAQGVATLVAEAGLSLEIDGAAIGPLHRRQAAALLRRIFDDRQTVSVRTAMAQVVGGRPRRAFGELAWVTRARGTTVPEPRVVFLALVHEEDGWRITQIRLLLP